jgi:tetratricopeptide (TPR) repeat protein
MHSRRSHASLGAVVMLALVLGWSNVYAQLAPATPTPTSASQREKAKKLTDDAIAAERAKDYTTAITLYQQAYQLVPHPILMFNIGQTYMLTGNSPESAKYFKQYLAHDPDGPGASIARKFLASLPTRGRGCGARRCDARSRGRQVQARARIHSGLGRR